MERAIRIELAEGMPVFKASSTIQNRIEALLFKQKEEVLSREEEKELSLYEELDDYLSFTNRLTRNAIVRGTLQNNAA